MASRYNYQTGTITFDFVLRKDGGVCHRDGTPDTRIGGNICGRCCWHCGSKVIHSNETEIYTLCKQDGAKDEGSTMAWTRLRQEVYYSAMSALDY